MQSLSDSPLLAAFPCLDRVAVFGNSRSWTWRDVHAASMVLAKRFTQGTTVCNLCGTRIGFLVTWVAAVRSGCLQVLPPSGGGLDLASLIAVSDDVAMVVDNTDLLPPHHDATRAHYLHISPGSLYMDKDVELSFVPNWDAPAVHLYTSGSTGVPRVQARTLRQLTKGAQALGEKMGQALSGGLTSIKVMVCSVPPQHMFGLETSVMLSLVHGIPIMDSRPLLPADVQTCLCDISKPTLWITTPMHLKALVRTEAKLLNCVAVIASTMPLEPSVAVATEALVQAPVMEIYGSTETGAIALRRPAHDACWHPLAEIYLRCVDAGTQVWGAHFESPQCLNDDVALTASGTFTLLGRRGDLIKIGGKRASLASLNLLLQSLPGWIDGSFYMPNSTATTERLVLIHAGHNLDIVTVQKWLRDRIDAAFLPRTLINVDTLPRTATGKLTQATLDNIYIAWREAKTER